MRPSSQNKKSVVPIADLPAGLPDLWLVRFHDVLEAIIVREPRSRSGRAILKKWPSSQGKAQIVFSHFLFVIYLWAILSDVVVATAHAWYHLSTHTINLHLDHRHPNAEYSHGHTHGQILDRALANVGKEEAQENTAASPPPLRLSRGFEHLFRPSVPLQIPPLAGDQLWPVKFFAPTDIPRKPLIPPPETA
ncbi:MAG TPA: hypothetical protein VGA99_03275 [bacterium]